MTVGVLGDYGASRMEDGEIEDFLASQGVGVLGLPDDELPYLVPLSFGYDGESGLYFTFVLGDSSRKRELTERTRRARFLVFSTESAFNWRSVIATGSIEWIPADKWDDHEAALENAWRPDLFESAVSGADVEVYRLQAEEVRGIKHSGLPPGFEA